MISPIAIATEGAISSTIKRTITIATIGLIVITGSVMPSDDRVIVRQNIGGRNSTFVIPDRRLLIADENEILEIIKAFTECQK